MDIINEAFTPSEAEIAAARRIVDAFAGDESALRGGTREVLRGIIARGLGLR